MAAKKKLPKIVRLVTKKEPVSLHIPLCYRCEYRAQYLEQKHAPRYECSQVNNASCGCYMYKPVRPVIQARRKGDKRPVGAGWMLSPRMEGVGLVEPHTLTSTKGTLKNKKKGRTTYTQWYNVERKLVSKKAW